MNHIPRKRFGQHFLHDKNIIRRIVNVIAADENIPIVEIGPGLGALTIPILKITGELDAVELDRELAGRLESACKGTGILNLHVSDALKFDFCSLKQAKIKITGNLPYNISTPLLFHLLGQIHCIHSMIFMLQQEVAQRICAQPGTKEYGRLSVMVQSQCDVIKLFNIAPGAFKPAPKVESSIIRLTPLVDGAGLAVHDRNLFAEIVKQAFSQRRKTITNALKGIIDQTVFDEAGIETKLRAENLSVKDFVTLANLHAERVE